MPDPNAPAASEPELDLETLGQDIAAVSLLRGDFVLSSGARSSRTTAGATAAGMQGGRE